MSSALARYSVVTPNRPLATCLMRLRILSPFAMGLKRSGSSPPSPVLDLPPIRFIAIARVVCASRLMDPNDIAPVENRLTISDAGSTSSNGIGCSDHLKSNKPRRVRRLRDCSLIESAKVLYSLGKFPRTACCKALTLVGFQA